MEFMIETLILFYFHSQTDKLSTIHKIQKIQRITIPLIRKEESWLNQYFSLLIKNITIHVRF
jgi:hypothetical protein